jgi:hypothetical protein
VIGGIIIGAVIAGIVFSLACSARVGDAIDRSDVTDLIERSFSDGVVYGLANRTNGPDHDIVQDLIRGAASSAHRNGYLRGWRDRDNGDPFDPDRTG